MRAEIVSIGTELLLGSITDTNASYLAQRLASLGIGCYYVSQVGDNLGRLTETLRRGWERSDLLITTGGLGPTQDDLTREAIASLLGETMEVQPDLEAELRAFFTRRSVEMPKANVKQATLIASAEVVRNPIGTAPGWWVRRETPAGQRSIVAMPGVPFEMKRMWEHEVEPRLRSESGTVLVSRTLKVLGMGESAVEARVSDLMGGSNPTLAPYAKQDGIHLRITAKGADVEQAQELIAQLEAGVRARLGDAIYGADDDTPQGVVRDLLIKSGYSIVLLEVGGAVVGSVSPLLWGSGSNGSRAYAISIAATRLEDLHRVLGGDGWEGAAGLQGAAERLGRVAGADVVLAVGAQVAALGINERAATAEVEVVVLTPDGGESDDKAHVTRVHYSWKTDVGEVRRLAGLAAYSVLRLRLLKMKGQGSG